jgi:hypothetical protein
LLVVQHQPLTILLLLAEEEEEREPILAVVERVGF